ncbi:MAG: TSUP family transporter [Nitrospinota bacterium]
MWPPWEHTLLIFAAGALEGAVGFDFGLLATPALAAALGVRGAVVLLCLPLLALNASRAVGGGVPGAPLRRLMPFIGAGSVGAAAGVFILASTPPVVLTWGVGLLVLLCVGYSLSRLRLQLDLRDETFFAYLAGFAAGLLAGLANAGGPLIVVFLDSLGLSRGRMARMLPVCALAFAAAQVAALSGAGLLPPAPAAQSAAAILPALAGAMLGRMLRGRFSPELGYAAGLLAMAGGAAALIVWGPAGWK